MYELLQKLGVPAGIAGLIGALIIMVPFIFQIDERYAKADQMKEELKALEQENQKLRVELAQLTGFMMFLSNQSQMNISPVPSTSNRPVARPPVARPPVAVAPAPAPESVVVPESSSPVPSQEVTIESPKNWKELNEGLRRQQERLSVPRDFTPAQKH